MMIGLDAILNIGGKLIDKLTFQCLFWRFSCSQPKINSVIGQSSSFTPFRNSQSFSKSGNKSCVSSIFSLIFSISPFAIFKVISFIVINALNTKIIWSFSHVAQKISKVKPAVTNCYASASVIFVSLAFWASTSFFNSFPYLIRRGSFSSQSVSM